MLSRNPCAVTFNQRTEHKVGVSDLLSCDIVSEPVESFLTVSCMAAHVNHGGTQGRRVAGECRDMHA